MWQRAWCGPSNGQNTGILRRDFPQLTERHVLLCRGSTLEGYDTCAMAGLKAPTDKPGRFHRRLERLHDTSPIPINLQPFSGYVLVLPAKEGGLQSEHTLRSIGTLLAKNTLLMWVVSPSGGWYQHLFT